MQALEPSVALLQLQRRAELRLPSGPLQEHHQLARHRERHLAAEISLDESQREIDPGGHASRCPDIAVANEDRIGIEADGRKAPGELGAASPMGDRAAAIEQAAVASRNAAAADGRRTCGVARASAGSIRPAAGSSQAALTPHPPGTISVSSATSRDGSAAVSSTRPAEVLICGEAATTTAHRQTARRTASGGRWRTAKTWSGPADVEKLGVGIGEDFDAAHNGWHETRDDWRSCLTMIR